MMRPLHVILAAALVAAAQGADVTMTETQTVERAIAEYQPAWLPDRGQLPTLVVVIDPAGGGAKDAAQRALDDLALLTAGHLYHLVQHAGGVPVMTRADDRPVPGRQIDGRGSRKNFCKTHQADMLVSIEFTSDDTAGAAAMSMDDPSRVLIRCLGEAVGVEVQTHQGPAPRSGGPGVPAAMLRLRGPDDQTTSSERQKLHRGCAERIYKAIAEFARAEGQQLVASRAGRYPGSDADSLSPVPYLPDRTWEEELARNARRIWPNGDLPLDKAAWFCATFCRATFSDHTFVYLEPEITIDGDTVTVGGATNLAVLRNTLADALRAVGVKNVTNRVRLLPEEGRLGAKRFGLCVAPMALTFSGPSESNGLQSQLLYGEPLCLLDYDHDAGYYLLHGGDGYYGWVREDCVRVVTPDEFARYTAAKRTVLLRDMELPERRIVQGSTLPLAATSEAKVTLTRPEGGTFELPANHVRVDDNSSASADRIAKALNLLYRPYVFGAVSPIGLDCSGLVRNICAQTGLAVSRDAAQQFQHGRLIATRGHRDDIRPGDFLFFINTSGKIFHVGIAISNTHFVHCAPPEVKINSLKKGDRLYSEYRDRAFFAAKRVP